LENKNKLKLVTIVGTRPELIRLSVTIKKCDIFFNHILVHTGQNYDHELNQIFFDELEIRKPDYFLGVSGKDLGETLGNIISKSFNLFSEINPDAILVLGDTNSSLSIISAKRQKIPIFHMEAGNRCFDLNVPEEINRKIADHLADINLTYSENSRRYLLSEGFKKNNVFTVGSPMNEVIINYKDKITNSKIISDLSISKKKYIVASIHREENIDIGNNLNNIIMGIEQVSKHYNLPVIFSTHPRTKLKLKSNFLKSKIKFIKPLGFFDYLNLQSNAFVTLSDSGTLSEESAIIGFPAVSIRTSTERPEAIDSGTVVIGNIDPKSILQSTEIAVKNMDFNHNDITDEYKVSNSSMRVVKIIQGYTKIINVETWRK
jgi:UDP-N-acetylglucosamine 2-epimerase (non-hydrolysing)